MGKASILSGGAAGLYSIKIDTGKATQSVNVAALTAKLAELAGKITAAEATLASQQALEDAAKEAVTNAIAAYVSGTQAVTSTFDALTAAINALGVLQTDPLTTPEALAAAKANVTAAEAAYAAAKAAVTMLLEAYTKAAVALVSAKLKTAPARLALQVLKDAQAQTNKDKAYWQALVLEETTPAWCMDLTENATGAVATVEIPGENKLVLIAPAAPAPTAADGLLTAREVQSPGQVFWNAAVLPGWQKYKPTYRRGTITAINNAADTADVALDADLSSAQHLGINQTPTLSAVPVQYMTCHSAAFSAGDKCVVKFTDQDWSKPKVVGFVDHPKSCGGNLYGMPWSTLALTGYPATAPSSFWARVLTSMAPGALTTFHPPTNSGRDHPGATSWCNPDLKLNGVPIVLSWRGPDYRYSPCTDWAVIHQDSWWLGHLQQFGQGSAPFVDDAYLWLNGKRIATPVPKIIAAALHQPDPIAHPERIILRLFTDYYFAHPGADRMLAFYDVERFGTDAQTRVLTLAKLMAGDALETTATYTGPVYSQPGWRKLVQRPHFNKSGTAIAGICSWNTFYKPFTLAVTSPETVVLMDVAEVESTFHGSQSTEWAWVGEPTWIGTVTDTVSGSQTETRQTFHAADFVGDVPVALYTEATVSLGSSSTGTYKAYFGPPAGSMPTAVYETYADITSSKTISSRTIRLVHTLHGELASKTYTGSIGAQTIPLHDKNGFFCGDLSRDMICFGLAETDITYSYDSISPVETKTVTRYNPRYELAFWYRNPASGLLTKSSHVLPGGYHFSGDTEPYEWAVYPPTSEIGFYRSPIFNYSGSSTSIRNQTEPANWEWPFQHAAADPLGRVAYFGAGQYHQGANVLLRAADDTLLTVPDYAPGAYPNTLMAPIIF